MELFGFLFLILLFLLPFIRQHMRDQKKEEEMRKKRLQTKVQPPAYPQREKPSAAIAKARPPMEMTKLSEEIIPKKQLSSLFNQKSLKQGMILSMILKNPYHEP